MLYVMLISKTASTTTHVAVPACMPTISLQLASIYTALICTQSPSKVVHIMKVKQAKLRASQSDLFPLFYVT